MIPKINKDINFIFSYYWWQRLVEIENDEDIFQDKVNSSISGKPRRILLYQEKTSGNYFSPCTASY
jgi:hypothetical protein